MFLQGLQSQLVLPLADLLIEPDVYKHARPEETELGVEILRAAWKPGSLHEMQGDVQVLRRSHHRHDESHPQAAPGGPDAGRQTARRRCPVQLRGRGGHRAAQGRRVPGHEHELQYT